MSFRDDLAAASEWVAAYLETVGERPVVARGVAGGGQGAAARLTARAGRAVRGGAARLRPADRPGAHALEPPALLRLLRQHGVGARDPGRAPDRGAERERDVVADLARRHRARAADARLARAAARPSAPGYTGTSRTPLRPRRSPRSPPRARCGPGGVVYASEHAHFSVEKAARLLGLELRRVPVDDEFRMLADFPLEDATAVVATVGTTSSTSVDPVARDRGALQRGRRLASRRCGLRRLGRGLPGAALVSRRRRASADSIVVNPHKWLFTPMDCSTLWTRRPEALREAFAAHGDYLALARGGGRLPRLRARARAAVPCAQALDRAPLLRARRGCRR